MKKLVLVLIVAMFMFGLTACKGSDSPKAVLNDFIGLFDGFLTDMDKADNADKVVAAIDTFSVAMQAIAPRMKALEKKYPELKTGMKGGTMPEEFKEFEQKFKDLAPRMMGLFGKMMQYANDPKVQAAQKKFQEAMEALDK